MALLMIDSQACIGCGACVAVCPFAALDMVDGIAVVNDDCTACGACIAECPVEALSLPERQTVGGTPDAHSYQGVWVWVEQFEGCASSIAWEMMGQGRRLADALGSSLTACVLGEQMAEVARQAISYGADRVFLADDPTLRTYRTEPYSRILVDLVREHRPEIFLLGASSRGRDLAG